MLPLTFRFIGIADNPRQQRSRMIEEAIAGVT
jgi:hypothetical protein